MVAAGLLGEAGSSLGVLGGVGITSGPGELGAVTLGDSFTGVGLGPGPIGVGGALGAVSDAVGALDGDALGVVPEAVASVVGPAVEVSDVLEQATSPIQAVSACGATRDSRKRMTT
ncbi:MAG TPA: hypothetical protein VHM70_29645 [Polyangiaceae bacterium]|nr:hypothetical protein [Polyangiaceae bacterium]